MPRDNLFAALAALSLCGGIAIVGLLIKDNVSSPRDVTEEFDWNGETRKRTVRKLDLGGGVKMDLVLIPAGSFTMDSVEFTNREEIFMPRHPVTISNAFYLGKYHVTVGQFKQFVAAENYQTQGERQAKSERAKWPKGGEGNNNLWNTPRFSQTDDHPVVSVSWNDAKAFCAWLSKKSGGTVRLPTEAEWEYSCRAGSTTRYYFGEDSEKLEEYAWFTGEMRKDGTRMPMTDGTRPVGGKKPNGFGLYDMHGNACQWCEDWWQNGPHPYFRTVVVDPTGPGNPSVQPGNTSGDRVWRGSSFNSTPPWCRTGFRGFQYSERGDRTVGFRVVLVR
jgi:formylglycine-generating enzyme required for sulfatase activity